MLLHALLLLGAQERIPLDRDDVIVDRSCVLVVGAAPIHDVNGDGVVQVLADDVTVRFEGPPLHGAASGTSPDALTGTGIVVRGRGVTLQGARVSGYRVGIAALEADGATIEDCDVSGNFRQRLHSTPDAEASEDWLWPHDNDGGQWAARYGAGILVRDSSAVTVRRCRARDGQNGLLLERVRGARVHDNDFSFLSGWGIALWRSSDNLIARNACDFCIRGYSHGVYNRGQDSAGILLFEQCSNNVVAENSATHCGDGIFAFAGREALGEAEPPEGFDHARKGNNDNLFVGNDLSWAAAHGLELTFSFGNRILANRLVENAICGIWGGYSRDTLIARNEIASNGDAGYGAEGGGVNIEHGQRNVVVDNDFRDNSCGVHLWWDPDEHLARLPWTLANGHASRGNTVRGNRFEGDDVAVRLRKAGPTFVYENEYRDVADVLVLDGSPPLRDAAPAPDTTAPERPLPGTTRPVGGRRQLAGRHHVVMTEWGPYDHEAPLLWRGPGTAALHRYRLLGATVASASVSPGARLVRDGNELEVRAVAPGVVPYELLLAHEHGREAASGVLVAARWEVRGFTWTVDPRDDVTAWRAEAASARRRTLDGLHLRFGHGGHEPQGDEATPPAVDRFGTIATSALRFPPGTWRLRTVSDDGIRVWIDEALVIDDWTHHGATVHEAAFTVADERDVRLRVEHFELDGAAVLTLDVLADRAQERRKSAQR